MLPSELKIGSARTDCFNENDQVERRFDDINFLEERRNQALIRLAVYQQATWRYHSRKVQPRSLAVSDLVLKKIQSQINRNKLSLKWECLYAVIEVTRPGLVWLAMSDGRVLSNSWNIDNCVSSLYKCILHSVNFNKDSFILFFSSMSNIVYMLSIIWSHTIVV